jgi:biopolymer transport protein TolQ
VTAAIQAQHLGWRDAWSMVTQATLPTKVVLTTLCLFSLISWFLIFWKWIEFRRLRRQEEEFLEEMTRAQRVEEAFRLVTALPDSPYRRVFRHGMNFFHELKPKDDSVSGLTPSHLESLRLILEKEQSEERDSLAHGLPWLAVIATVSPLLGLLGTVIGVMNAFVGVAAQGTANISAVAPGIAEALITTVTGLAVAIPAVIAYNLYASRLGLFAGELEGFAHEFIGALARERKI